MTWASGAYTTHRAVEGVLPEQSFEMQLRFQSPGLCTTHCSTSSGRRNCFTGCFLPILSTQKLRPREVK